MHVNAFKTLFTQENEEKSLYLREINSNMNTFNMNSFNEENTLTINKKKKSSLGRGKRARKSPK
jgi:hypothetical protein